MSEITEDAEYRVDFNSGGKKLSLLVVLAPNFPLEKPILKIIPLVQHSWVNEKGEITGAPGLLNVSILQLFRLILLGPIHKIATKYVFSPIFPIHLLLT